LTWDAVGYQGRGVGIAEIAGIADIAVIGKQNLPLIHVDVAGSEKEPPRRQGSFGSLKT
jgi:hypothetical protein